MTDRPATPTSNSACDWDVFISHAGGDSDAARRLNSLLETPARVFLDKKSAAGRKWTFLTALFYR